MDTVVTDERLRERGWVRLWDDVQQLHYYCNESTGELCAAGRARYFAMICRKIHDTISAVSKHQNASIHFTGESTWEVPV